MAALASTDVTYTLTKQRKEESGNKILNFTLAFGNGALTYPSGGVPLTGAYLGCPNDLVSLKIVDSGNSNGYVYKFDLANKKIRIYQAPAQSHAHDLKITKGAITTGTEIGLSADAASATLNNNTISATITLAKATNGIQSETLAAAALVELGSVAIAATTLKVEAVGW